MVTSADSVGSAGGSGVGFGSGSGAGDRPGRPGPPPRALWRDFFPLRRAFGSDARDIMVHLARTRGPFVRTRLPMHIYFVSAPALIEEILVKQASAFHKDPLTHKLSNAIGNGLLVNEGEPWRRQRRLMQPAFHQGELRAYSDVMAGLARDAVETWRPGEVRDVHADMMMLTMSIVARLLFGADVAVSAGDIGATITALLEDFQDDLGLRALTPLGGIPTLGTFRIKRGVRRLDRVIYEIIGTRRRAPDPGRDLLGLLLRAQDEDGSRMSDQQLRDEVMTLFLAGHETTALVMTYALYLLATHPERQTQVIEELDLELRGGRDAGLADLERLKLTEAVLLEAMRLYPPVWSVGRQSLADVEVGGYLLPKGSTVFMSQWVVQRDPALFEAPDQFRPERWLGDLPRRLPRFAYFPFGGGPRVCIGNRFAMMEAMLILSIVLRRFWIATTTESALELLPTVTLRPKSPVRLRMDARPPPVP